MNYLKTNNSINILIKSFQQGNISKDILLKAVSKYGEAKRKEKVKVTRKDGSTYYREQSVGGGKKGQEKQPKVHTEEELKTHAKNASEQDLQRTIKEHGDEKLRVAAHNELERRTKEEHPQEEDKKPPLDKQSKTDTKESKGKTNDSESVSKEENKIFDLYQSTFGEELNNYLRTGSFNKFKGGEDFYKEKAEDLDKLIRSHKLPKQTTFRYVPNIPEFSDLKVGGVFTDKGFMSTTREEHGLHENFFKENNIDFLKFKIDIPEGSNGYMDDERGEDETLLGRNRQFKIKSIKGGEIEMILLDENPHIEKFRTLSDEQVKFYLDAPYPEVKEAAKFIADERGLSIVSKEDYIKEFEDYSEELTVDLRGVYSKLGRESEEYLDKYKNIYGSLKQYLGNGFKDIRTLLTERSQFVKDEHEGTVKAYDIAVKEIQEFIHDNKIKENLSLHRMVLTGNTFFDDLKEGDVYEDKSFSSTSLKKMTQFGDFNINILAKGGSSVANVGNSSEFEYLIDKGSKFRVIEKREDGLGITVELL